MQRLPTDRRAAIARHLCHSADGRRPHHCTGALLSLLLHQHLRTIGPAQWLDPARRRYSAIEVSSSPHALLFLIKVSYVPWRASQKGKGCLARSGSGMLLGALHDKYPSMAVLVPVMNSTHALRRTTMARIR